MTGTALIDVELRMVIGVPFPESRSRCRETRAGPRRAACLDDAASFAEALDDHALWADILPSRP
jgi:hypothetical protein